MRKPPLPVLSKSAGAFDLPSIITGVVVVGILAAGVLAAIFGVIPFAQDRGAKQDLSSIRTAEGVAKAKDNRFMDHAGLLDIGYLQLSSKETTKVFSDEKGTCYVGIARSGTGKLFFSTDRDTDPALLTTDTDPGCISPEELAEEIEDIGDIEDVGDIEEIGDIEEGTHDGALEGLTLSVVSPLQVNVSWTHVKGAPAYRVQYRIGDGEWLTRHDRFINNKTSIYAQPEQVVTVRVFALIGDTVSAPSVATAKLYDTVLKNPSFELGGEFWELADRYAEVTSDRARTGTNSLTSSAATFGASQIVNVPANTPVLTYWSTGRASVRAYTTNLVDTEVVTEDGWTKYNVDISEYAGKTVKIELSSRVIMGQIYIDDVALESAATPDSPTAVAATSRSGGATVTWTSPVFSGGTPITSYTATAYLDGEAKASVDVAATLRTATVPNLRVGSDYTFKVTANNAVGASDPAKTGLVRILDGAIANPSFELGTEGWTMAASYSSVSSDRAHTGTKSLMSRTATFGASQVVNVPADTPVLTYWSTGGVQFKAYATSHASTLVVTQGDWSKYSVDVSAYTGKTVKIDLSPRNSMSQIYIDDIAFEPKG